MRINFNRWALPNRIGVSTRQLKLPLCQSHPDASLGYAGIMNIVFRGKNDIGEVYSDRVGTPNLLGEYAYTSRLLLFLNLWLVYSSIYLRLLLLRGDSGQINFTKLYFKTGSLY